MYFEILKSKYNNLSEFICLYIHINYLIIFLFIAISYWYLFSPIQVHFRLILSIRPRQHRECFHSCEDSRWRCSCCDSICYASELRHLGHLLVLAWAAENLHFDYGRHSAKIGSWCFSSHELLIGLIENSVLDLVARSVPSWAEAHIQLH